MAPGVIGRDEELVALESFLETIASGPGALVLRGDPGIGKTALWEAGIEAARERGIRILFARPGHGEAHFSFTALTDLLDRVDPAVLATLPSPQRQSLEVALLRAEPAERPPELRAIGAAVLHVVRELTIARPLLVAIDDAQWLDPPSTDALAFAARRFRDEPVGFLLTERSGGPSRLWRGLEMGRSTRIDVGALSFGAAQRLLADRLGLTLPRRVMRRVFDSTGGNPLFVLEVGRTLIEQGPLDIGEEIPLPDGIEDLLGVRVTRLSYELRKAVLAVALSVDLRISQLAAIVDSATIDDAIERGLLVVDGDRVRASHPMLAAAARGASRASERRSLHMDLARVSANDGIRARHLAMAATHPDDELAARLSTAAGAASARGARQDAVELARHALRLTPSDSVQRIDRLFHLGECLELAGELGRLRDLLKPELDRLPAGMMLARAHILLMSGATVDEFTRHLEAALAQIDTDPGLRARLLSERSIDASVARLVRLSDAEAWAAEALSLSEGPPALMSLNALAWTRILRGSALDDLVVLGRTAFTAESELFLHLDRLVGIRQAFRGHVSEARATFVRLLGLSDQRGEGWSYRAFRHQLCELELRAGETLAAQGLLDDWDVSLNDEGYGIAAHKPRLLTLLAAERGIPDQAERWAAEATAAAEASRSQWDRLEIMRASGIVALFAGEHERAVTVLRAVWRHTEREGIDDPGAFPVAPDLVESLVALGEIGEAQEVTERLSMLAEEQEHPWGLATTQRCRALLGLASNPADGEALLALTAAASAYQDLGLRFDRARSLLILGRSQRRARRWGDARRSLAQALAAFDAIGSTGWADQTRSEVDRVGARRPAAPGTLTSAEERVVELAAEGRSNKEIAHALSIGVHTVEVQLSRAYAKLGVQSRAQLARRLAAGPSP